MAEKNEQQTVSPEEVEKRKAQLNEVMQNKQPAPPEMPSEEVVAERQNQLRQMFGQHNMLPEQMEQTLLEQAQARQNAPKKITSEHCRAATAILEKYRTGKQNLERRIVENELWYRQQHWEQLRPQDKVYIPSSGWVFNSLANKHADLMDNVPECSCLPQEQSDEETARVLTDVLPVVLEQAGYDDAYDAGAWNKIKTGTAVYGVFWNPRKNNGLGDVDIKVIDLLSLFWEPGVTDIQKSRNVFSVELMSNEVLISMYPDLKDKLSTPAIDITKYVYDDSIDTSEKSAVVDWYYKKIVGGKTVLGYVKYVGDTVLYSSEDDENAAEGYYAHGMYPFVVDRLFPEVGTLAGFGYIDVMKDNASTIDRLNAIIVRNAEQGAMRRYFTRNDTSINMDEFTDWTNPLIHVTNGNLGDESLREYVSTNLSSVYVQVLQAKIDELKEVSSNRDFSQGSTSAGVTSGAAIAALQEAGNKTSRDIIKGTYRAYADVCKMVIEIIRQFYDVPRFFRITGEDGSYQFQRFDNSAIMPQQQSTPDLGITERLPVFDIKVKAHKANPFSRAAQNQDAINFFGMGFFNPQLADQALTCLEMMEIEGKDKLVEKISENGTMAQQLQQMQQTMYQLAAMLDEAKGTNLAQQLAAESGMAAPAPIGRTAELGAEEGTGHPTVDKAREKAQNGAAV